MTAEESRKNRILELIIDKVFASISPAGEQELDSLLNQAGEDREHWEKLMNSDNLIDFIVENFEDSQTVDLASVKAKFFEKIKGDKKS